MDTYELYLDLKWFIVFTNLLFFNSEYFDSEEYEILEYILNKWDSWLFASAQLLNESIEFYFQHLEEINEFIIYFQKKWLDIEDDILDIDYDNYKNELFSKLNEFTNAKTLFKMSQNYYELILWWGKENVKRFITHINTTIDDKIFNDYLEHLIDLYKFYYNQE